MGQFDGLLHDARTALPPRGPCRPFTITLGTILCAVAISGCGSSSRPRAAAGSSAVDPGIRYADCMRANGVPDFPDPSAAGGGAQIQIGSGINPLSPSFKAAQSSCAKLMPGGGPGRHPSERDKLLMLQLSKCMRRHGITGFPDPTLSPPSSPVGYSLVEDRGGVVLAIPKTIDVTAPAFRTAAVACGFAN